MRILSSVFILGMVTAFLIQGAIDASGLEPLYHYNLPWWVYAIGVICAISSTVIIARRDE